MNYAATHGCTIEKFAVYFLNFIKSQTEEFTQINSSACSTPKKLSAAATNVHNEQVEKTQYQHHLPADNQVHVLDKIVSGDQKLQQLRTTNNSSCDGRKYKRDLFSTTSSSPDTTCSPTSLSYERRFSGRDHESPFGDSFNVSATSTPIMDKSRGESFSDSVKGVNVRRSADKSKGRSICLADFITTNVKSKRKSQPPKVEDKPKKRVVPLRISKTPTTPNEFVHSSFKASNNLLQAEDEPVERNLLKTQKDLITKDFMDQGAFDLRSMLKEKLVQAPETKVVIDLTTVSAQTKNTLLKMADLYAWIIEKNLTINILSEIAYIINLLNLESDLSNSNTNQLDGILKNLNHCIYFALAILERQRHLLAQLDATTIKVLIENELLNLHQPTLVHYLATRNTKSAASTMGATAMAKVKPTASVWQPVESNILNDTRGLTHVIYQQEDDNADNFPTYRESAAFRSQRDIFYDVLRTWEYKHLNPSFNFMTELRPKVKSLLGVIDHPINMAHLAKLFTAQLIISCNFDHSASELQMVLPNIDLTKLSKLQERLSAPSAFSTQYMFPGNQTFFRDFIVAAENVVFMEQLKVALVAKLIEINDNSFVALPNQTECIPRPESITTMRVLAKFVGFVTSRPYTYEGPFKNVAINERQIALRNLLLPTFDVKSILLKSITEHRLLVVIPWMSQYLSMLDYITLRLDYYKDIFSILFELYILSVTLQDPTRFVLRICLGWLFEHPNVPKEYYTYRQHRKPIPMIESKHLSRTPPPVIPESIVVASCPFLSDFRVAIMPMKREKQVSRTGQYRHIRTKLAEEPVSTAVVDTPMTVSKEASPTDNQGKLLDAFLQSQSVSMRKVVEFVIERVTSAVVKDFQFEHLIPKKKEIMDAVKEIKTIEHQTAIRELLALYTDGLNELLSRWDEVTMKAIQARTVEAFNSLLPKETIEGVKKLCIDLALSRIRSKVNTWQKMYMQQIDIFTADIRSDARSVVAANKTPTPSTHFIIKLDHHPPSKFFYDLQKMLHFLSIHPSSSVNKSMIADILDSGYHVLTNQVFTSNTNRLCAWSILQLILLAIANHPDLVDDKIIQKCIRIWKLEIMQAFVMPPPESVDDEPVSEPVSEETPEENNAGSDDGAPREKIKGQNYIFSHVISARLIIQINSAESVSKMGKFLDHLTTERLVKSDLLCENLVSLFRHEWPQEKLDLIHALSGEIQKIEQHEDQDEKSHLFLELVSELSKDLENFET